MALVIGGFVGLIMSALGGFVYHDPRALLERSHVYCIFRVGVVLAYAAVFRFYVLPLVSFVHVADYRTGRGSSDTITRLNRTTTTRGGHAPVPPSPEELERGTLP